MKADELKRMNTKMAELVIKSVGLRKKYEEILIMKYVEDMSCEEIADAKNYAVQSIYNLSHKARMQFEKFSKDWK